jgi:large subunit ribosomal protein L25
MLFNKGVFFSPILPVLALSEKSRILFAHSTYRMTQKLSATIRTENGSKASAALRSAGKLPAVVYGAQQTAQSITLIAKEFEKVWHDAGESSIVELSGLGTDLSVLIQDVSVDPLYGTPTHADLLAVRTDETIEVTVPLEFVGVAPAEKLGGTLIKVLREIDIEALPKDLPHSIEVDISTLVTFEDQIHVSNLVMPTGVTAVTDSEEVVALVQEAGETEEESSTADVSAVEVVKKGKEEPAE